MNKRTALIMLLLIFFVGVMSLYWLRLGFDNVLLRESLYLVPSGFATIAGMFALWKFGLSSKRSMTFLLLTAGMGYWFCGELLFAYYEYIAHISPYPSIADVFYVLAYPLFLAGLVNEIRITRINWKGFGKTDLFLFILVALLFATLISYFGIYQAYDSAESLLGNLVAISYGIGDLLLILANILVLVLVWEFRGGKLSRVWLLLFISFILTLVADILFAMYTVEYTMQEWFYKSLLDSFWIASYLLFGYALCEFSISLQEAYQKVVLRSMEKGLQSPQTELVQSVPDKQSPIL